MGYMSREQAHGSSAGLAFYVGIYCAVAVGLVLGFIALFEPTRLTNPGLSAYKPPPRTVIADVPPSRPQHPPQPIVLAQEPEPELPSVATALTTPPPAAAEKPKRAARVEKPRRARSAARGCAATRGGITRISHSSGVTAPGIRAHFAETPAGYVTAPLSRLRERVAPHLHSNERVRALQEPSPATLSRKREREQARRTQRAEQATAENATN